MMKTTDLLELRLRAAHEQATLANKLLKLRRDFMAMDIPKSISEFIQRKKTSCRKQTIMVIDDDPLACMLIAKALGKSYEVISAHSATEGLKYYAEFAPDMLLLDIEMPHISGHDFLKKIFSIDPSAFIVMYSSHMDADNIRASRRYGAKGFITKPFRKDDLMEYIHQIPQNELDIAWE